MATIVKDAPSVQRLMFGKYVTPTQMGHCHSPVLSFMRESSGSLVLDGEPNRAAGMIPITSAVEERLRSALLGLDTPPFSMDAEKGPYADKDGMVQRLAKAVIGDAGESRERLIDRAMDLLRPFAGVQAETVAPRTFHDENYNFILSDGYGAIPDVVPYAGEILTRKERRTLNADINAPSIILTSMMEPYVLAAAVLRQAGLAAYPSLAVLPDEQHGGEMYTPVMSIVDITGDVPLQTFALLRSHPDLSSLILMSDAAVMGVLNIIVAETRATHLCVELVEYSKQGVEIEESVVDNQLKRIANALFEGHRLWPGTHFINDAVAFLNNEVAKASVISYLGQRQVVDAVGPLCSQIAGAVVASQTMTEAFNRLAGYAASPFGGAIEQLFETALASAEGFSSRMLGHLSTCMGAGQPQETFEHNRKQPGQ